MGGVTGIPGRFKLDKAKRTIAGHGSVDKQHEFPIFQVQRMLDLQLKIRQQVDSGQIAMLLGEFKQQRTQGIVAPAEIAIAEQ